MGERARYAPGTFCWVDLTTTDQDAAKAFYGGLFGWEAEDMPVGDGVSYSMMRRDGQDVAAIAPQPDPQREAGMTPVWNSYVSVQSADTIVERARALGGQVHAAAFDVAGAGRMGMIQDPQGAHLMVWQPRERFGAMLVNAPGAVVWNELASTDLSASRSFYGSLFGWEIAPFAGSPHPYLAFENDGATIGGMRELDSPGVPPHWLVYFGVADIEAALAKVRELGGAVHGDPIDIQMAKIAVVGDPQGATFALYAGLLEP